MKKKIFLVASILVAAMLFTSCPGGIGGNDNDPSSSGGSGDQQNETFVLEYENKKSEYETELSISTKNISEKDECYVKEEGLVKITTATPVKEDKDMEITLSGYFKGQIENNVKGLVINLNGVYLENENAPVILGNEKTEISAKKETENYIVAKGNVAEKTGAIESAKKKNLDFGGSGKCYIVDNRCHGIKSDKVEFKGSGEYFIQGTKEGSAVNCNEFVIKPAKEGSEEEKIVTVNFYNAKNGIKADKSISIKNGKLNFFGNKTALKTDKADLTKDDAEKSTITLANCTITKKGVTEFYETDEFLKDDASVMIVDK